MVCSYSYTGSSLNIVFFPRLLERLPPLPRQHSAAIGCTKNYQPIGVTVHLRAFNSDVGEGGAAVNCEKTQFLLNTLYIISIDPSIILTPCRHILGAKPPLQVTLPVRPLLYAELTCMTR